MRPRTLFLVLLAVFATMLFAGCGDNNPFGDDSTTSKTTPKVVQAQDPNGTATTTATASQTTTPNATCPGDHAMKSGDVFHAAAGCNVKGDVFVGSTETSQPNQAWVTDHAATDGDILVCVTDCWVKAPYGANVTPRTVADLIDEMKSSGCGSKCATVQCWVYASSVGLAHVDCATLNDVTKGGSTATPTSSATPGKTPTTAQPMNDRCEPELKLGEKRVVLKGCIVVGDVLVRPAKSSEDFRPVYDNRQKTGTVQQLAADTEVWNVQGTSIMPEGFDLESIVIATKVGGCGTGNGCTEGIFDWSGKRLDK